MVIGKLPFPVDNQQSLITFHKSKIAIHFPIPVQSSFNKLVNALLNRNKKERINLSNELFEQWYSDDEYIS